jgi:hypothetical protein
MYLYHAGIKRYKQHTLRPYTHVEAELGNEKQENQCYYERLLPFNKRIRN